MLQGVADVRLQALAHRHDLQHEPRAPLAGRRDGVRVARRRRRPHRRHDLPDVPRPPPPRGHRATPRSTRLASTVFRHAVYGPARALLRRHLRLAQDRLPRASSGCPASATSTPAASARTWSSTTCSTSCCSRCPTTTRTRTSNGPYAQVTSIAEADQQLERLMHAAGGPDAFLEDHAMIVCSDHSQSQVEAEIDLFKAFDGFGLEPPMPTRVRRDGEPAEIAVCPASRSAQVYVLDRERRTELDPAHRAHGAGARGRRPRDAPDRPPRRRGARSAARAASCASCPAASCSTCAASAGASRATSSCST